jgi:DNA-binding transcriptional LysR family regulator
MIDLRRLRALLAVVTTGSVREAAAQLGYTPSAISQHVAALERETGVLLLERIGRGVRPTEGGRLLADHAVAVLDRVAEAERALAAHAAGETGRLNVASFATAGAALVPRALAARGDRSAPWDVCLHVADTEAALAMLRRGNVDLAVIEDHGPPRPVELRDGLQLHHLATDPFRLVLPRGHPLARRRVIALEEMAQDAWIDIACEVNCCRAATNEAFEQAGFVPRRAAEAEDYWPAQGFVAAGLGVALIPALALRVLHDEVVVRRLRAADQPVRHVVAATRPTLKDSATVHAMIGALRAEATL